MGRKALGDATHDVSDEVHVLLDEPSSIGVQPGWTGISVNVSLGHRTLPHPVWEHTSPSAPWGTESRTTQGNDPTGPVSVDRSPNHRASVSFVG